MAGYVRDSAADAYLNNIRSATTHLYILSAAPADWTNWANVTAVLLGSKAAPTIGTVVDGASSGRRIIVSAITDGTVSATGGSTSGELWALVDQTNQLVYAASEVTNDQLLTNGNVFTLTSFDITVPDPA